MAKNLSQLILQTSVDGTSLVYVGYPDGGNPYGYSDASITLDNLFLPLQTQVSDNASDIATNTASIVTLNENSSVQRFDNRNAAFDFLQAADSMIEIFSFRNISGSPVVSVGTSLLGADIVSSRLISGDYRNIKTLFPSELARTLFVTVSGGFIDLTVYSKLKVHNI